MPMDWMDDSLKINRSFHLHWCLSACTPTIPEPIRAHLEGVGNVKANRIHS